MAETEKLLSVMLIQRQLKKYSKVIIDPVIIFKPKNATAEELADLKTLSSNSYSYLVREMSKDYKIVKDPAPDALKVQTAILDARFFKSWHGYSFNHSSFWCGFFYNQDFCYRKAKCSW